MKQQQTLVEDSSDIAELATRALDWLSVPDNATRVGAERKSLTRMLRRGVRRARRLSRSAGSNMSVSVFGPSQAGKSFLVSVLARPQNGPLMADFGVDGGVRDYIREINPEGEGECTGIVTRFTIRKSPTPEGFPVRLTLLNEADILRAMINSFYMDGDQSEPVPEQAEISSHLDRFRDRTVDRDGSLDDDDVWDVADYVDTMFGRTAHGAAMAGFWEDAVEIAPRLSVNDRATFFSILWGGHDALTRQFAELASALVRLGCPEEIFAGINALIPRETSVIDVKTLAEGRGQTLAVCAMSGQPQDIDRAVLCALAAELVVPVQTQSSAFFSETDLLDFPGARNRFEQPFSRTLEKPDTALPELLLRGKVAYLFDRYVENHEITSMLLCVPDSNMETLDLPGLIENWIATTHGATPQIRAENDCVLFFVLTKFDKHLGDSAAEGGDISRFERRMQASLIEKFGRDKETWVNRWTPDAPFRNCFWLRNPNYYVDGLIEYDAAKREVTIRPEKAARVADLRAGCLEAPSVVRHFQDPEAAWDAALTLNDGGVGYLIRELERVCKPDSKIRQIRGQIAGLRDQIVQALAPYHVSDDIEERIKDNQKRASAVIDDLEGTLASHRFGALISDLQIDQEILETRISRVPNSVRIITAIDAAAKVADADGQPAQKRVLQRPGSPQRPAVVEDISPITEDDRVRTLSLEQYQSDTAIEIWIDRLNRFRTGGQTKSSQGLSEKASADLVAQLIQAAQRLGLSTSIANELSEFNFGLSIEKQARPAAIVGAEGVNRFVAQLGMNMVPASDRPQIDTATGDKRPVFATKEQNDRVANLPATPRNAAESYWTDWVFALDAMFTDNAKNTGSGEVNVEQNLELGRILDGMRK